MKIKYSTKLFVRSLLFPYLVERRRELYTPTVVPPHHLSKKRAVKVKKKTHIEIRFTNIFITAFTIVTGKDVQRRTFFCGIPVMKELVSNQEKGTFYLNSKQEDLWPSILLASATLHGTQQIFQLCFNIVFWLMRRRDVGQR